jgi:HNH endonuclease
MTVSNTLLDQIRQRARFACEYCGVTETDTGGVLTLDHFQPRSRDGTDALDNLLYCCFRCNLYKADYWPLRPDDPVLWNPRQEAREAHLLLLSDSRLYPITSTGEFTLERLRLNRPALIAYRMHRRLQGEEELLLMRYRDTLSLLEQLRKQHLSLLEEQRALLAEQQAWMRLLRQHGE